MRSVLGTAWLAATAAVCATSLHSGVRRDRFLDGSGRDGPPVRAVGPLTFSMGSDPGEPGYLPNQTRHPVKLSEYAIGVYEITNRQFCEFLNEQGDRGEYKTPWAYVNQHRGSQIRRKGRTFAPIDGKEDYPVVAVTWRGARAYCRWLSAKTGGDYDLPTGAQWEAAARAGVTSTWPWGSTFEPRAVRCRRADAPEQAAPVGSSDPNAWGFYDMVGNVWEWVRDCFDEEFYRFSPLRDPLLWNPDCMTPEIRGGSFHDGPDYCRPGFRSDIEWNAAQDSVGFRVERTLTPVRTAR
jgi:formylglycine-generating enzyme